MSALRDLVGGGAGGACAAPDERAGSSNPLGRLADTVLGDRKGKHPETRSAPRGAPGAFADQFLSEQRLQGNLLGVDDPVLSALPGGPQLPPGALAPGGADVAEFLRFRDAHQHDLARGAPPAPGGARAQRSPEHPLLSRALRSAVASTDPSGALAGRSQSASAREAFEGNASGLPLNLSPAEKTVIRARSAIMARHLHADAQGSGVAHARLSDALAPLGVEVNPHAGGDDVRLEGPRHSHGARGAARAAFGAAPAAALSLAAPETAADARQRFLERDGGPALAHAVASGWADDFAKLRVSPGGAEAAAGPATATAVPGPGGREAGPPGAERWAEEFSGVKQSAGAAWATEFRASPEPSSHVGDAWAAEFRQEQAAAVDTAASSAAPLTAAQAETAAHSARLAATLAADPAGKFRDSQFLRFMSRMSRGELVAEGDGVTERRAVGADAVGNAWASEYAAGGDAAGSAIGSASGSARAADPSGWASEFDARATDDASAATAGPSGSSGAHRWADEFADLGGDWAGEFQEMAARGEVDRWTHDSVWNAVGEASGALEASRERSRYEFVDPNPYLGRADAAAVGRDLFRRGVLSEAALALEAAVRADPASCEGWRLLSTVHAENDDDRRAIAAATKAHEADPTDLEALLSLGVSHTNELDAREAAGYMRAWLKHQPRFAPLEAEHASAFASDPGAGATPAATLALFKRAARLAPGDADVRAALGVLAHLARSYDEAIAAFNAALDINPNDYSLWNKLGATQANSARSAEAMAAYQRALDLKPNYVRAWANMGIGYANQGKYERSVGFYVRALSLNPRAESVWGYLRISLGCCGRVELMEAVDNKDLVRLQAEFPL